jgi:hypothetical protein
MTVSDCVFDRICRLQHVFDHVCDCCGTLNFMFAWFCCVSTSPPPPRCCRQVNEAGGMKKVACCVFP